MVRIGKHTLRDPPIETVLVKEKLVILRLCRWGKNQQVEVVKNCLLLRTPVIVMEVIFNPEEALVEHLRDNRLLERRVRADGKLNL